MSAEAGMTEVSIDIGGTFTDVSTVADGERRISKVLSTPADYGAGFEQGLVDGLGSVGRSDATSVRYLYHGTTIATNTVLTRSGGTTALVTTAGFGDALEIRRLRTPVQFSLLWRRPDPLVPRERRFEVVERLAPDGSVVQPLDVDRLDEVVERLQDSGAEAVAVCLLHAYANGQHERLVADVIRRRLPGVIVCCSSDVIPRPGEYERTSTTVVNSYLLPEFVRYSDSIGRRLGERGFHGPVWLMESAGTLATLDELRERPVSILESGPAGGVMGASYEARTLGYRDLVTLDIGGTTAKACLIQGGQPARSSGYEVGGEVSTTSRLLGSGGYAISLPTLEIAEIGAGGGSIVAVDRDGTVSIGPQSAGADPGPACYGRGGQLPTLTDAHVVLGRIPDGQVLGGQLAVDREAAVRALSTHVARPLGTSLEAAAQGALALANVQMLRVLKGVTVERGADPRGFALFAYGGMAGLHAAELAAAMGIETVVIPMGAGVFSSYGLMTGAPTLRRVVSLFTPLDRLTDLDSIILKLIEEATGVAALRPLQSDISWTAWLEIGYAGHDHGVPIHLELPPGREALGRLVRDRIRAAEASLFGRAGGILQICTLAVEGSLQRATEPMASRLVEPAPRVTAAEHKVYWGPEEGWCTTGVTSVTELGGERVAGPVLVHGYDYSVAVPPGFSAAREEPSNSIVIRRTRGAK